VRVKSAHEVKDVVSISTVACFEYIKIDGLILGGT